jgi:membrane protease YdiL (CAAX protease family)
MMTAHSQKLHLALFSGTFTRLGVILLLVSTLPNILWMESTGQSDSWLLPTKALLLIGLLLLSWRYKPISPLRPMLVIVLVLLSAEWGMAQVTMAGWWQGLFGGGRTFVSEMMGIQIGRLVVSFVIIGALLLLRYSPRQAFLTIGNLNATAQPVPLLGMKAPTPWSRFGVISLVLMSGVVLTFLFLAGRPSPDLLRSALPLLPFVLIFALMNAWSEEISYRVSLITTTEPVVGAAQAVWLSAIFFGIGHYYGVPYGIVGVLLSTFFGYILGKSLVETRGLAWAILLHIVADIWIFTFMAIGSVTPGG